MDIGSLIGRIVIVNAATEVVTKVARDVRAMSQSIDTDLVSAGFRIGQGMAYAVGAIGTLAASIAVLGNRGADINDVADTLDKFAGSGQNAAAIMENLRKGTMGVITDFDLL